MGQKTLEKLNRSSPNLKEEVRALREIRETKVKSLGWKKKLDCEKYEKFI